MLSSNKNLDPARSWPSSCKSLKFAVDLSEYLGMNLSSKKHGIILFFEDLFTERGRVFEKILFGIALVPLPFSYVLNY